MSRFAIHAASIDGTVHPGCNGYTHQLGAERDVDAQDGSEFEVGSLVMRRRDVIELTLFELGDIFKASIDGGKFIDARNDALPMAVLDNTNGLKLYGKQEDSAGPGFLSTASHVTRIYPRGVLFLTGLSWSAGQKAEASLQCIPVSSDGSAELYTEATSVALPSRVDTNYGWVLDQVQVAGVSLSDVPSVELSIDPKIQPEYQLGRPLQTGWTSAGVNGPMEVVLAIDAETITTSVGTGATSLVFKKLAHGGGYDTSDGTLTITLNGTYTYEDSWAGQHGQRMAKALVVRAKASGATMQMAWAIS